MSVYRHVLAVPLIFLWTLVAVCLFVVLCLFNNSFAFTRVGPLWGKVLCFLTPANVSVTGKQNLVKGQSYIVVANHASQYDIPIVCGYLPLDLKWVAKKELAKHPIIGPASFLMGNVFVDRSKTAEAIASLDKIKSRIHGGTSLLFFPEGTRSKQGHMLPFKNGAFIMAKDLGLPILPISIVDADKIMPSGEFFPRKGNVQFVIHSPITTEQIDTLPLAELVHNVRCLIQSKVEPHQMATGDQ